MGEFAEVAYTTALASYDGAQAEARRQSRYLAAHVQPSLAQKADPDRSMAVVNAISAAGFVCFVIMVAG